MPSLWKRENTPYYFACYTDALGRRVKRSTKKRERSEAWETCMQWAKLAKAGREKTLSAAQARRIVSEMVEQSTGEPLHFHSCQEWLKEWVTGKKGSTSDGTFLKYEQVIRDFLRHLGPRADLPLPAISPRDVRGFRDALASGGRAATTVNLAVKKTLNVPFSAAHKLGYIPLNPVAAVESLKDSVQAARGVFTFEQVTALAKCATEDWRGAILTGFYTGLRLGDVAELVWESVDLQAEMLKLTAKKTGGKLLIPFHPALQRWMNAQPRGIGKAPVFPSLKGKRTGGMNGLSAQFVAIIKHAGIERSIVRGGEGAGHKTGNLSFHSLRHSFVSALANAGVASDVRKKLVGHADDRIHARYSHHEMDALRHAVNTLPTA